MAADVRRRSNLALESSIQTKRLFLVGQSPLIEHSKTWTVPISKNTHRVGKTTGRESNHTWLPIQQQVLNEVILRVPNFLRASAYEHDGSLNAFYARFCPKFLKKCLLELHFTKHNPPLDFFFRTRG